MKSTKQNNGITINLSDEEVIVFFDWITHFNENENTFQDQAEERVLFDLEPVLEQEISETFKGNYNALLQKAREEIRD